MQNGGSGQRRRAATPWHLWMVAIVFLAVYAIGARDYVLSLTLDEAYFDAQGYGPAQVAYFTDYPIVPAIFWTFNVAGGIVAALLLLFRSSWAAPVALVSAASQLVLSLLTFGFRNRWEVFGPWLSLFDIAVMVLTFAFWLYCRAIRARGVVRSRSVPRPA